MNGPTHLVRRVIGVTVVMSIAAMVMPAVARAAPKLRLSIADASIVEGDDGSQAMSFRITHTGKPTSGIKVNYATTAVSATSGMDFASASGTATLTNGGCKCATVVVDVVGDLEEETTETFQVNLSNPVKAAIADGQAIGTIYDNDGPPAIVVLDVLVGEADDTASLDVALTSTDADPVLVEFTTADDTALEGNDYTATSGIVTFLPGDILETVSVPLVDDEVAEDDQQFSVTLDGAIGATIERGEAMATIVDDDPDPTLTVADLVAIEGAAESSAASVSVSLSSASEKTVEVGYATSDDGASAGTDYTQTAGVLTFEPGETEQTFDVTVLDDSTHELDEDVALELSEESNAALPVAGGHLTIADDDAPPALSIDDVAATEGDLGTTLVTFTVTKSGSTSLPARATWSTVDGTATGGVDYTSAAGSLEFDPAVATEVVEIEVQGDLFDEPDEEFSVTLADPTGATIADDTGVATIEDDDDAIVVGKTETSLTARVVTGRKKVKARGMLEAAEAGARVRVVLQARRDGRFQRVAGKTVAVSALADRDADTIDDAVYRAAFRKPARGRYRFRIVFAGSAALERSVTAKRFRI